MVKKLHIKRRKQKQKDIFNFLGLSLFILVINLAADQFYRRMDLTKEKRYTLSNASKEITKKLDDVAYFNVYLEGDFTADYKRLRTSLRDMLNEFRIASNGKIEFEFENVLSGKEEEEKKNILKQLHQQGVFITRPDVGDEGKLSDSYIIPGGVVFYKGKEYPLNCLVRKFGLPLEEQINLSVEQLEYEIAKVLSKCVTGKASRIAILEGHGEVGSEYISDLATELSKTYTVERMNLNIRDTLALMPFADKLRAAPERMDEIIITEMMKKLNSYDGIIIAKPQYPFKEIEKFMIDQYVMNGGKVLWMLESLIAEMDSVAKYEKVMTADYDLNINDILFRFGVKLEPNLIQDKQCHGIPTLRRGGQRPGFMPWVFYPLFSPQTEHPVVRNLGPVWGRFCSSWDTTNNPEIRKTILLHSSEASRVAFNPVLIDMDMVMLGLEDNAQLFTKGNQPFAVLCEGAFKSSFQYRESYKEQVKIPFKDRVEQNSMIFIGDGDFGSNQLSTQGEVYPLGYDKFASSFLRRPMEFANKTFLLNCVDYLCDASNLISIRSKKIPIRLLDKNKVKEEKAFWQWLNMGLPVLLILLFGLINVWIRRRKYSIRAN
jgi:ABC-2 type transport system permease protein